jgi:hypothetical protein
MIHLLVTFLLTASTSLQGSNEKGFLVGDVSPAAPKNSSSVASEGEEIDDTGEVDEDIIITDDESPQDDEGVSN